MKKHTIYLLLIAFFAMQVGFASNASEYAVIKGTNLIKEYDIKEFTIYNVVDGKPVVVATAKINTLGEFGFNLPITTPGFYYVDFGQFKMRGQLIRLYLEPNLDIDLKITLNDYELGGKNMGQNALVKKANEIYNDFGVFCNMNINKTYVDFYPFIDGGLAKADAFSKSINTKDAKFNALLKLAVETDVQELSYMFFRMPRSSHPEKNDRPAVMKQWEIDKKFTNPDLLKLANGSSLMDNYFFYKRVNATAPISNVNFLSDALTHIIDPALKEVFCREYLAGSRLKIEEYERVDPILKPYLTSATSKAFLLEYEKTMHKEVGQKGLNFTYNDINDKPVSFSDFKGKYVYIDLWATWCGPCKAEIPFMKKIEEDYHGKNIVFVSLSLDAPKDLQKWKDFVKKEQLQGIQLVADQAFKSDVAKNYDVTGIPRFLLFDPKGNIINADAMRPSNPELRVQFDKLLK